MVVVILILFLLLFTLHFLFDGEGVRDAVLRTYLIIFGLCAIIVEILSIFNQLEYQAVLIFWLGVTGITALLILYKLVIFKEINKLGKLKDRFKSVRQISKINVYIVLIIGLILLITLIIAVVAPPNNYDSMIYHMARVAEWIQHRSVNYYSTSIARQNYSMPLAEYMILNLQLLSRSDRFANLVQWSGFLIAIIAASEIARFFRLSRSGQLLAAFFTATLPMAILQSTSTQNDLITGVFCMLFAYFLLRIVKLHTWRYTIFAALAFGLALLTKGTAYVFCAAIGLAIGGVGLFINKKEIRMKLVRSFLMIIFCGLIINTGVYVRNYELYSHPLSTATDRVTNDKISGGVFYANLIRNAGIQLASPVPELDDVLTKIVAAHLGESISDPRSTFIGSTYQIQYYVNEDEAGNLLHFLLITFSVLLIPWIIDSDNKIIGIYTGAIALSVILFSILFKWQPWGSRLQLPIFLLGSPLMVYLKEKYQGSRRLLSTIIIVFSLYTIPYLILNETRPLVPFFREESPLRSRVIRKIFSNYPYLYYEYSDVISPFYVDLSVLHTERKTLYFSSNMDIYQDYKLIIDEVNELNEECIGLHLDSNDWEYPIWTLTERHASVGNPQFVHVAVNDISNMFSRGIDCIPSYIISTQLDVRSLDSGIEHEILIERPTIALLKIR